MFWQYPEASASLMQELRAQSWPVSGSPSPPATTTTTGSGSSPTGGGGSGKCSGVAAWSSGVAYTGGQEATYKYVSTLRSFLSISGDSSILSGHLWTAKWWSEGDTPGGKVLSSCQDSSMLTRIVGFIGAAGDWTDDGAC